MRSRGSEILSDLELLLGVESGECYRLPVYPPLKSLEDMFERAVPESLVENW